jgi:hypothetical protein
MADDMPESYRKFGGFGNRQCHGIDRIRDGGPNRSWQATPMLLFSAMPGAGGGVTARAVYVAAQTIAIRF